jgi:hypothetical protein
MFLPDPSAFRPKRLQAQAASGPSGFRLQKSRPQVESGSYRPVTAAIRASTDDPSTRTADDTRLVREEREMKTAVSRR